MAFPPSAPETLADIIPAYLYTQYNDDDNVRAFFDAYNAAAQYYLDWFNDINLPVYTGLSGSLLDWIANGLYDLYRPALATPGTPATGPINEFIINSLTINDGAGGTPSSYSIATDDIFKRIMTWYLYKGDGKTFTLKWLKRRTLRFLLGTNGTAPNVADTSQISITISTYIVTIDLTAVTGVAGTILTAFQEAIEGSVVELPPQYQYKVIIP